MEKLQEAKDWAHLTMDHFNKKAKVMHLHIADYLLEKHYVPEVDKVIFIQQMWRRFKSRKRRVPFRLVRFYHFAKKTVETFQRYTEIPIAFRRLKLLVDNKRRDMHLKA